MKTGELTHASLFTGGGISTDAIHCALDEDGLIAEGAKWVCEADWKYIEEAKQHCLAVTDETVIINGMVEEVAVSYTHLRAHETRHDIVCRLLLEKK